MKYTFQSIKYIAKNFIFVLPFAILPAFFFALSIDEVALETLLTGFFAADFEGLDFGLIFRSVSFLGFSSGWSVLTGFCGLIALAVGGSLLMAWTEQHMRIGKRSYLGVFSKLNDNILSTAMLAALLMVCYELFALILSAMFFLAFQFVNPVATYIFCAVAFLGMHFVLLFLVTLGYLWLPCMHITGFHAFEALQYSHQLSNPIRWEILLSQFLLMVVAEGLIAASVFIPSDNVLPSIVAIVFYAFMIMLFCVRMQIVYFDRTQMERADLKPYYAK